MSEQAETPESKQPENNSGEDTLYASRKKLHVRSVKGRFATWRWILVWATQILFYGLPWVSWNDRQAVLFDLAHRKFYIFGWVFWPQDVIYLTILLIISAIGLFLFTAVAGRLWCGYACPQTVYTEIFLWIEEKVEGDHNKRRKLELSPWDARKIRLRGTKFLLWGLFALFTGFTFICYFSPRTEVIEALATFSLGPWQFFWLFFYSAFTYLLAGVLREQVCKYMCPYARFQSVMFDPDTLIITYDEERGEPRGPRKKNVDPKTIGKGDCIDCDICVQVCPTGIDIRKGLQYECIGCAACVDACDEVMDRMNYPRGLVRYTTERALKQHWTKTAILKHIARPRIMLYTCVLGIALLGLLLGLSMRSDLRMDVLRDRAALAREMRDGSIENIYRLNIMNMVEAEREVTLSISGLDGIRIIEPQSVKLNPLSMEAVTVKVHAPATAGEPGPHKVVFDVSVVGDPEVSLHEGTTFILPR